MTKPKQKAPVVRVLAVQTRPDHITVQLGGNGPTYTYEASPYICREVENLVKVGANGKALQLLRKCPVAASIGTDRSKHKLHECTAERCFVCDGGLASCDICHGAEAGLPTQCPGRALSDGELLCIGDKKLDFKGGTWQTK